MASLNILCSDPHNFLKEVTKKMGKYIRAFFVVHQKLSKIFHDHQYLPKIFHGPCKTPGPPPILNIASLALTKIESS